MVFARSAITPSEKCTAAAKGGPNDVVGRTRARAAPRSSLDKRATLGESAATIGWSDFKIVNPLSRGQSRNADALTGL